MTSRSRTLAVAVVLVAVALGLGAGGVAAADDIGTQDDVTVHLVGDDDQDDGEDTIALFEEEVPPEYSIEYIDVADVDEGIIDETDVFVLYDTDEDEDLITAVEDDVTTGAVYLDQFGSFGASNAIPDRSAVTGDPAETDDSSLGFGVSLEYSIEADHPIFEGVAGEGETVQITDGEENRAWFEEASGETLATVGTTDDDPDGPAVAVDPDSGSVLVSSIAVDGTSPSLDDLTDEAGEILGNAVVFAEPELEDPFFEVSDLDAPAAGAPGEEIDVSATITNLGNETGTQDVVFEFDGAEVDTEPDVELDAGQNTTVTFENIGLPEEVGVFEHGVFTDDDDQTAEISVDEDVFEVTDLDAPAAAPVGGEIDVSATITNTGQLTGTQDVVFEFNESVVDTEPDVELDPGQNTTVTFEDIGLPEEVGVFEHGVFTDDDNQTAEISVEEEFFAVTDLDAPLDADLGAEVDVTATITNTADVVGTQDVVFEFDGEEVETEPDVEIEGGESETVEFLDIGLPDEEGIFEHGVFTDDDNRTAVIGVGVDVSLLTVVQSGDEGEQTLGLFEEELPESFITQVVDAEDVTEGTIEDTDAFVFHDFAGDDTGPESPADRDAGTETGSDDLDAQFETLIETVEGDVTTGAVYLDQWGSTSNAIPDRSAAIGDPEETDDGFSGDGPVTYDVQADHPIFDGVADPGESVDIHDASFEDRAWFEGASGETLAEVSIATEDEPDGPAVAVDPDSGSVLLSSIAVSSVVDPEDYTAEAGQILANAAEFADPDIEDPFFQVTDLAAPAEAAPGDVIDVNATVTNVGNEAGTQDVEFVFDGDVVATEEDVTLDPEANTTVAFEPALPDVEGVFEHGVFTANDSQTAEIDVAPPFFEVSDLDAPADAGPGTEIDVTATITNTGNGVDTQDVEFVFDGETVETEPDVTLDPGENTTVEFLDIGLPDEEGVFEHGVFTDDDNQTAEIAIFPEFFEVTDLDAPAAGAPGEEIDVSATITNTGNEVGTQDVVYVSTFAFGDDEVITEPDVTLDPGENVTVAFEPTLPDEVGTFEHGVFTDDDEQTAEISVEEDFFAVSDLDAPAQADPGAEIDVTATVTNTGQLAGTQDVDFVFDGAVAGTEANVTLDPDEETTVAFENVTLPDTEGIFEHGIFTEDDSQTATIEVGEPEAEIELSVLEQPESVRLDDPIVGSVTVTNTGTAPYSGEFLMVLRDDFAGDGIEQAIFNPPAESLELDPGESTTVSDDVLNFTELNDIFEDNPDIPEFEPGDVVPTGFQVGDDLPGFGDDELEAELLEDLLITTDEGSFFQVSDLDAPAEADPGAEIDVSATITNIGPETGTQTVEFVFDDAVADDTEVELDTAESQTVTFENITLPEEEAFYEHGVFTEDDNQTALIGVGVELTTVTVVQDGTEGEETLTIFEDELPGTYETPQVVDAVDVTEDLIEETDTFVFQDFAGDETGPSDRVSIDGDALTAGAESGEEPDVDFEELITTVEDDVTTGAVYLDNWGSASGSNAIGDRSEAIGDPEETDDSIGSGPIEYVIEEDHPIFDGVGEPEDVIDIHTASDFAWFDGASGDTLATVQDQTGVGGSAVAVDPDSGSVLVSSIAVTTFVGPEDYTDEAGEILGNAVVFAEPDVEPAVFEVSDLDAPAVAPTGGEIDVSATVTNTGGEVGTQDVEFVFDDEVAATEANVTLDPEAETTVTFEDIGLPEEVGVFEHGVFTDDDSQTAEISVEEEFFAVSDLDAPAEAGAGETIEVTATVTNTGNVTGTQDIDFVFDGEVAATEPDVTLDPDESEPVAFEPTLPEEGGTFEHGVFTDDDSQTAEITVTDPPQVELSNLDVAGQGESATVLEGDHDVSADMTHVDGGAGEVEATLTIGDAVEETATVDIGEGETETVTFEDVTADLGTGIYDVEMTAQDETLTGELTVSVDVGGEEGTPATDTTGDGLLNDLTGDGEFDIMDVQALFENFNSDAVQENVELFDFLGDDRVTIFDVQALFNDLDG